MSRIPVLEASWRYSMDEGIGGSFATGRCERLTPRRLPEGYGDLAADRRRIAASLVTGTLSLRSITIRAAGRLPLDRPPSRRRNPDSDNFDCSIARHHVALCYCKPGADEISQHVTAEDMAMNELLLADTKAAAGEQL
jgi:hypothetical protein